MTVPAVALGTVMIAHVAPPATAAAGGFAATASAALAAAHAGGASTSSTAAGAASLLAWAHAKAIAAIVLVAVSAATVVGGGVAVALVNRQAVAAKPQAAATPATAPAPTAQKPATLQKTIVGRVLTPDEQPVAHASVHAIAQDEADDYTLAGTGATDGAGAFRFTVSAKNVNHVIVDVPGYAYTDGPASEDPDADIVLQPAGDVELNILAPDGKPLAGVRVEPVFCTGGSGLGLGDWWWMQFPPELRKQIGRPTDAGGRVTLARFPRGSQLRVDVADDRFAHVDSQLTVHLDANGALTRAKPINLSPASSISGRVTYADGPDAGNPAALVRIGVQNTERSANSWGSALTDANGVYRVTRLNGGPVPFVPADQIGTDGAERRLTPGEYNVAADLGREQGTQFTAVANQNVAVGIGQDVSGIDFKLIKGVTISGKVTMKDTKQPVADINVGIYGPAHPRSGGWVQTTTTNAAGEYSLRVPPGEQYIYLASTPPEGYGLQRQEGREITAAENSGTTLNFELAPLKGKPVSGRVVGPDGKPVADASVSYEAENGHEMAFALPSVQTDAQGRFQFRRVPPKSKLRATGRKLETLEPLKVNGGEKDVTLKLQPSVRLTLTGVIVDPDGKPVPAAKVSLTVMTGMFGLGTLPQPVDASGRYAFPDLAPGKRYSISAVAPRFGRSQADVQIKPEQLAAAFAASAAAGTRAGRKSFPLEQPRLTLVRAGSVVTGTIVDELGQPAPGIKVQVSGRATNTQFVTTDAQGKFAFADVVHDEPITIYATDKADDVSTNFETKGGTVDVMVTLKKKQPAK